MFRDIVVLWPLCTANLDPPILIQSLYLKLNEMVLFREKIIRYVDLKLNGFVKNWDPTKELTARLYKKLKLKGEEAGILTCHGWLLFNKAFQIRVVDIGIRP